VCHSADGKVKWKVNWKLSGFAYLIEQLTSSARVSLAAAGTAATAAIAIHAAAEANKQV
jgi:hypothetical protein